MVIVMQEGATDAQIQQVIDRLVASGFNVHRSTGESHTVLGAVGVHRDFDHRDFEVMDASQIQMMLGYVDIFQVGARNMQNYYLLRALGEIRKPVLLKRGMSATMEELLMSAEYILAGGNYNVILCERGIRTFETYT